MSRRSFMGGAAILMVAGFFVRILGFIFRIYLSNLIGAEGMGVFQLVAPIYSLIILTVTSGISIAVSKMVAAEYVRKHYINLKRITWIGFAGAVFGGLLFSIPMFLGLDFIVNTVLKDARTYYSILFLIPAIPLISAASAFKGYFYGMQDVTPTAVSQVVEQIVKIGLVMAVSGFLLKWGLEYACAIATVGMAIGEISNLFVLLIFYNKRKDKKAISSEVGLIRKRNIVQEIVIVTIPVSFNRLITSGLNAIEQILIPRRLVAGGLSYHLSIEVFGRLSGMAMPLITFPCLVTSSLATTLVPAISEAISVKNYKTLNYRINKSIEITFVLGFVFTAVFCSYANEIGNLLYPGENIGPMLYGLSFACIFIYLQQTLLGVLNGLGKQVTSLQNSIIGSSIRIGFLYLCVPTYGVKGYFAGIFISSLLVCILNLITVVKTTGMAVDLGNWLVKPTLASLLLIASSKYVYSFFTMFHIPAFLTTITSAGVLCMAGLLLMAVLGVLDIGDILKMFKIKSK